MSDLRNKLALMTWGDNINISGYQVSFIRGGTFIVYGDISYVGVLNGVRSKCKLYESTSMNQVKRYFEEILEVKEV